MKPAIKIENVSKQYRLGVISTGTLSHDLNRWWANLRGKEDPFLKVGETNNQNVKGGSEYVWALKDINLDIMPGDVLGIVGKNGAGKSTLLKLLSRVTAPTQGKIVVRGRIASLLEVGTGFHPELTGRENVFLNGAILGMAKSEISRKFDEIVDFSGVERYIDTPVKRYSSGMYVRLAFAVAAHLEPEILVVDEVLAVGDIEFQKKALGKMQDVSRNEGRTVLFVSHNLSSIRHLCKTGIVLTNGQLLQSGTATSAIDFYLNQRTEKIRHSYKKPIREFKDFELVEAELLDMNLQQKSIFDIKEKIVIQLHIECKRIIPNLYGYLTIRNGHGDLLIESDTFDWLPNCMEQIQLGHNLVQVELEASTLAFGNYVFNVSFASTYANNFLVDTPEDILSFSIEDNSTRRGITRRSKTGYMPKWKIYAEQ
jgi:lipopolysaccharide transport system ATP-binding protein